MLAAELGDIELLPSDDDCGRLQDHDSPLELRHDVANLLLDKNGVGSEELIPLALRNTDLGFDRVLEASDGEGSNRMVLEDNIEETAGGFGLENVSVVLVALVNSGSDL